MLSKILPSTLPKANNSFILALKNEKRVLQIKPFKRIHFQFDPFHPKAASIREFMYHVDSKSVRRTNPKCLFKTDILVDQQEPTITAHLENGKKIVFKTANLSLLELLQYFNQYSAKFTEVE